MCVCFCAFAPAQPQEKLAEAMGGGRMAELLDAWEHGARRARASGVEGARVCKLCPWIHLGGKLRGADGWGDQ